MHNKQPLFKQNKKKKTNLFDQFIAWGCPFGEAGINNIHKKNYDPSLPYFQYANKFLPHSSSNTRSWFLKHEFLKKGRKVFTRTQKNISPTILNREGLISDGRYLYFAKAYLNVIIYYRDLRSPPFSTVYALIFLEKAIRDTKKGKNDPILINKYTFEYATRYLEKYEVNQGLKYDIGKDLEMMSEMLQSGYYTQNSRFKDIGFRLIDKPFSFKSSIPNRKRRRILNRNNSNMHSNAETRLTNEDVASVGLAYRASILKYGKNNPFTFIAAAVGLSLTTVSMRLSELIVLRRDALYDQKSIKDGKNRTRIRISRPKINIEQDLQIPKKLSNLAKELFNEIIDYSNDAHIAFKYYINKYGSDFNSINKLYIPPHLKKYFNKKYLSRSDVDTILGTDPQANKHLVFPQRVKHIKVHKFVESPNDISKLVDIKHVKNNILFKISDIERTCKQIGVKTIFPKKINKSKYIIKARCKEFIGICTNNPLMKKIFINGKPCNTYMQSMDLHDYLLNQFKSINFPHWPYVTKEKNTRLDNLLLVWFDTDHDGMVNYIKRDTWWRPMPVSGGVLTQWISAKQNKPPTLFEKLDIYLQDGSYPSLTIHKTRKHHHTEALLAGAEEIFIDKLAGRKSGHQSDHYDLRTPHEIVSRSIETFDPDQNFDVIGPIAKDAPPKTKIIERKVFLYENAAPKQITDVGGCRTDWSINPCEQYGDCMRCDKSVWRKGDLKRLPYIKELHKYSLNMISIGEKKLKANKTSKPIIRHLQQYKDTLKRCNEIFAAENDPKIKNGTIITFSAAKSAFSTSQLTSKLRNENCQCYD